MDCILVKGPGNCREPHLQHSRMLLPDLQLHALVSALYMPACYMHASSITLFLGGDGGLRLAQGVLHLLQGVNNICYICVCIIYTYIYILY